MRGLPFYLGVVFSIGVLLGGCGSDPEDVGNRLVVTDIAPDDSVHAGFVFYGVEETDDVGCDGTAGPPFDGDGTEQNGFWDGPECAESKEELADDLVDITLRNEPRLGVENSPDGGRPLLVTGVRITYRNPDGTAPAYAPQRRLDWGLEVPDDETVILEDLPLITKEMKAGDGATSGIRDLFFTGAVASQLFLDVIVDIFVEDTLNNESFSEKVRLSVSFINPNI